MKYTAVTIWTYEYSFWGSRSRDLVNQHEIPENIIQFGFELIYNEITFKETHNKIIFLSKRITLYERGHLELKIELLLGTLRLKLLFLNVSD
jgi:hypothetical protein